MHCVCTPDQIREIITYYIKRDPVVFKLHFVSVNRVIMSRFAIVSALAVLILAEIAHAQIPQDCIDCICEIESGCKALSPCCNWDVDSLSCGSFQIKEAYWIDGGRQGGDWQTCACGNDCSIRTMQAYAARYTIASRIGHTPTCEDYARNHNGGPDGYARGCTDGYWAKIKRCLYNRGR